MEFTPNTRNVHDASGSALTHARFPERVAPFEPAIATGDEYEPDPTFDAYANESADAVPAGADHVTANGLPTSALATDSTSTTPVGPYATGMPVEYSPTPAEVTAATRA